jgi:PKD repeat protein
MSDTGAGITYKWDFGDNNFSTEKKPVHSYSLPGTYVVTLYTFLNNLPSDTFSTGVRTIIGQKEYRTNYEYTRVVDLEEMNDKGILAVISHNNSSNNPTYSLLATDSFLRQKWIKPLSTSSVRLNSIKKVNANEFILSGNYQTGNTNQFALSKINSNGDLVWEKYISAISGINNYTIPTTDGNLITIGLSGPTNPYNPYTVVVKCDGNGNEIWRKYFDGVQTPAIIRNANNIIETSSGYVFASLAGPTNQIVLTKLDFNGNIIGQTFVSSGNIGTIFEAGVASCNNSFLVFATNTRYVFMFDANLNFVDSRMIGQTGIHHAVSGGSFFYVADGSFQYSYVIQLSTSGMPMWNSGIDNSIPVYCTGALWGATRYCKKLLYTSGNDVVAFSEGQNNISGPLGFSVYLARYLQTGFLK